MKKNGKKIDNTEELKKYYDKLINFRNLIGSEEAKNEYIEYFNKKEEQIKKIECNLENKALMVVEYNPVINMFRKIKNFFAKKVFQN